MYSENESKVSIHRRIYIQVRIRSKTNIAVSIVALAAENEEFLC